MKLKNPEQALPTSSEEYEIANRTFTNVPESDKKRYSSQSSAFSDGDDNSRPSPPKPRNIQKVANSSFKLANQLNDPISRQPTQLRP